LLTPEFVDAFKHCCGLALMDDETAFAKCHRVVRGCRKQEVKSLCVPCARRDHGPTPDHQYLVRGRISALHRTFGETQLVIRNQDQSVHARLHRSEQYFTFSQSRAHALRHSKGSPQRSHVRGACPFLTRAMRGFEGTAHRGICRAQVHPGSNLWGAHGPGEAGSVGYST
jgi:hypothetical protein